MKRTSRDLLTKIGSVCDKGPVATHPPVECALSGFADLFCVYLSIRKRKLERELYTMRSMQRSRRHPLPFSCGKDAELPKDQVGIVEDTQAGACTGMALQLVASLVRAPRQ